MFRFWKVPLVAAVALAGVLSFARSPASAATRPVVVVRGFYGPGWWYGPGWYGWYGPYWGPAYAVPATGTVKLKTQDEHAAVYVDGGYAGVAKKLKKFPLRPGTHDIALRDLHGQTFYQERVEVIAGRTTEIRVPA